MIRIVFYRQGEVYYGFEETGHSGFDEAGHDIVCAAVSAMTMFLINAVEVGYACDIEYAIDEKTQMFVYSRRAHCRSERKTKKSSLPWRVC